MGVYMLIVYIYDIKAKNKRKFNRTKRRFYYHLNKLPISKESWKTKSTITTKPKLEKLFDNFFKKFKNDVIVYKLRSSSIERIE